MHLKRTVLVAIALFAASVAQAAPVVLQSFSIGNTASGINTIGSVTISPASTTLTRVFLSSGQPSVIGVPDHVDIQAGAISASFQVKVGLVPTDTQIAVTASYADTAITLNQTVNAARLGSFTVSPNEIQGGTTAQATVTFVGRAGAEGQVDVSGGFFLVPSSVPVHIGQDHVTFTIGSRPIGVPVASSVVATYGGVSETIVLADLPAKLNGFNLPGSVASGATVTGTLHLNGLAGPPDDFVHLTSSDPSLTVPPVVRIPAGSDHVSFTATAGLVNTPLRVLVTASFGATLVQQITLQPAGLLSLNVGPNKIAGGRTAQAHVSLNGPAVPGGATITLSSSDPSATVPGTITIPAGERSANFAITTSAVATDTVVTISASYNGVTVTTQVTVKAS